MSRQWVVKQTEELAKEQAGGSRAGSGTGMRTQSRQGVVEQAEEQAGEQAGDVQQADEQTVGSKAGRGAG